MVNEVVAPMATPVQDDGNTFRRGWGNTGTSAITGWTLTFAFPGDQEVTSAWNANVVQSGQSVTATNLTYNAAIAPGGNTASGLEGTWTASDANPATFTLNGTTCT